MKRLLIYTTTAVFLFLIYCFFLKPKAVPELKEKPMTLEKHSKEFNNSINKVVEQYILIKDALVIADTAAIKKSVIGFIEGIQNIDTTELKKDTSAVFETVMFALTDMQTNASSMLNQHEITEMRRDFSGLTEVMYPTFFNAIVYEGPTLYLQNCPMAFNDNEPANWISNTKEIINPYMGKNHPKYKAGMLNCGDIKDTIKSK